MSQSNFALSWDSYKNNICNGLSFLQQSGEFVDMTLAADGHHVKVHQMIISLVSPYIKDIIRSAQCPHPVIFLNKISHQTLQLILEYAYKGEVLVGRESLAEFLEACNSLHIKGLEDIDVKCLSDTKSPTALQQTSTTTLKNGNKRRKTEVSIEVDNKTMCDVHIEDTHLDDLTSCDENKEVITRTQAIKDELIEDDPLVDDPIVVNPMKSSVMQYSLSVHGTIQLLLNRYIYYIRHTRKNNNERMWRCKDYKNTCPAFVRTKDGVVIERGCAHVHPYHDKEILKRMQKGNVYSSFKAIETAAELRKRMKIDNMDHF